MLWQYDHLGFWFHLLEFHYFLFLLFCFSEPSSGFRSGERGFWGSLMWEWRWSCFHTVRPSASWNHMQLSRSRRQRNKLSSVTFDMLWPTWRSGPAAEFTAHSALHHSDTDPPTLTFGFLSWPASTAATKTQEIKYWDVSWSEEEEPFLSTLSDRNPDQFGSGLHDLKLQSMKAAADRRETDMFPVCEAFTLLPLWHEKHHPSSLRVSQDPSGWQLLCAPWGRPRIMNFRLLCLHFCTWMLLKTLRI